MATPKPVGDEDELSVPTAKYLQKTYGITRDEWISMWLAQQGRCYICQMPNRRLHVDHRHALAKTAGVRASVTGLICWLCNTGLQKFFDNPTVLVRAAAYLMTPPAKDVLGA
jgi:Recombination endonuclease VII